jgi:hypothetical protein
LRRTGWLFGKEVHHEQAKNAEKRATEASEDHVVAAASAAAEKARGWLLRRQSSPIADGTATSAGSRRRVSSEHAAELEPLVAFARESHPERATR